MNLWDDYDLTYAKYRQLHKEASSLATRVEVKIDFVDCQRYYPRSMAHAYVPTFTYRDKTYIVDTRFYMLPEVPRYIHASLRALDEKEDNVYVHLHWLGTWKWAEDETMVLYRKGVLI